jgi:hypothetical protein
VFPVDGETPSALAVEDLNGDGFLDLAVGNGVSNDVSILRGDGAGYFSPPATFAITGDDPRGGIIAVDLDDDGMADVATANHNTGDVSVLLNVGAGSRA